MTQHEMPSQGSSSRGPEPVFKMFELLNGMWVSRAIQVAAQLGIADLLRGGARSTTELAAATGTHAPSLYRLLRTLAGLAIFAEVAPNSFAHTELSQTLCSEQAGSARAMAIMMGSSWEWNAWRDLDYSVRTGQPAFDHVYGMDLWHYYREENPEAGKIFDAAMSDASNAVSAVVTRSYDFSSFHTVVDVGGGEGRFLAAILLAFPHLRGTVFDRPRVIEETGKQIAAAGLATRCTAIAGDFLEEVPEGADVYLLKSVLHDWEDKSCLRILTNCRKAIAPGGRLLVVEAIVDDEKLSGTFAKLLDLQMLNEQRGCERTATEFQTLFASAGFDLKRVIPLPTLQDIIEAVPV